MFGKWYQKNLNFIYIIYFSGIFKINQKINIILNWDYYSSRTHEYLLFNSLNYYFILFNILIFFIYFKLLFFILFKLFTNNISLIKNIFIFNIQFLTLQFKYIRLMTLLIYRNVIFIFVYPLYLVMVRPKNYWFFYYFLHLKLKIIFQLIFISIK